jgi:hypothetical protein
MVVKRGRRQMLAASLFINRGKTEINGGEALEGVA